MYHKVLRTWVTGVGAGQKASNNIAGEQHPAFCVVRVLIGIAFLPKVRDLEADGIGKYDDTVLNLIDQLMVCLVLSSKATQPLTERFLGRCPRPG
jgi:mannan endo-1,4-beta-mannosidase